MDAIFRFFKAEETFGLRVKLENGESQKTEGPVRKGASGMWSSATISNVQSQNFSLFITINPYFVNIID